MADADEGADVSVKAEELPPPEPVNSVEDAPQPVADVSQNNGDAEPPAVDVDSSASDAGKQVLAQMDGENIYYKILSEGFHSLCEARENKEKPLFDLDPNEAPRADGDAAIKSLESYAMVNFIDPTTKGGDTGAKASLMSTQKAASQAPPVIENVYEKLTLIFKRDYGSTIRSVPYKSMRSGGNDLISSLPIRPLLTRNHAQGKLETANVPWGGTAGTAAAPVSDPSEWHNGPFCHVYIAACSSLEHYRSKVRPSLQAFASQIEAAATNAPLGGNSAHYLIVYVPTGPKTAEDPSSEEAPTGRVGTAFANRIQKARKRIANLQGQEMTNDSTHSEDSLDSADIFNDPDDPDARLVNMNLLTKKERSVFKKINNDFANGKTCVLSPSSLDPMQDDSVVSETVAIKTQEWNSFIRMLGSVIVNGFKDRCRRYNEELRRLDSQRAPSISIKSSKSKQGKKASSPQFNLAYFFLVKESLAFTFEQMHLPAEALLHYDEFRAFLQDAPTRAKKSKRLKDDTGPPLVDLADAGDRSGFRRRIRSETDLAPVVDIVRRYLFARELCLLFKMEDPVELISRCQIHTKTMYSILMRGIEEMSPEDQKRRMADAAKWVVKFSWDIKCASDCYFKQIIDTKVAGPSDTMSVDTPASDWLHESSENDQRRIEKAVVGKLSELLETARLFLKQLGDTELEGGNPIRFYETQLPEDLSKPWQPWLPVSEEVRSLETDSFLNGDHEPADLLKGAFDSTELFEAKYRELTSSIISLCRFSNRKRTASRLQDELAENLIRKGNLKQAARIIKSIVKLYRADQWDRCHFWRLCRLAYCQRTTAKSTEYLKTLVTCFTPRIAAVAPPKALAILQEDLQLVIGDSAVGEQRYGKLAFIEAHMSILETSSDESTMGTGPDRKQLIKRYCSVGETVRGALTLHSHLPKPIALDTLKIFIVSFVDFSAVVENRDSVEEEDAFKILSMGNGPVEVNPGTNTYDFEWVPLSAGQYILSTVEVKWKEGFFYYDNMELGTPLLGVDVLPSEPTHSLALDPAYLVPGHDQQVKLTFDSGSDMVTVGTIKLSCSAGLKLIPPGQEPESGNWQSDFEMPLKQCKPGEQFVLTTYVRCGAHEALQRASVASDASEDVVHGLSAKVITTYLHEKSDEEDRSNIPHMKTVLEAAAHILEKTALTVDAVDASWYPPGDRAMVSVSVQCNTPHSFSVEEWKLYLPAPLRVAEGGDFNGDLLKCTVSDGDQLALAFECVACRDGKETKSSDEPILHMKLRDDIGKVFELDLPLDLNELYGKVWEEEVPSGSTSLTSKLSIEALEGTVGEPVSMTFTIDTSGLSQVKEASNQLVYSIASEYTDWIVGGKVDGILQCSDSKSVTCEVIGIPTLPGVINRFPTISLGYESSERLMPLMVKSQHPPAFRSLSHTSEMAVASSGS
jgi:hypothetical protein